MTRSWYRYKASRVRMAQNVNADGDLISGSWQFYIRSNGYFFLMTEQSPFLISSVTSVVIYFNTSYWGTP